MLTIWNLLIHLEDVKTLEILTHPTLKSEHFKPQGQLEWVLRCTHRT